MGFRNKKIFKVITVIFTITLFILFNGLEFLHHHNGSGKDEKCQVCSLTNTLSNSSVQSIGLQLHNNSSDLRYSESVLIYPDLKTGNLNSGRAPPVSD